MKIVTRAEWGAKPARSRHVIDTPTPRLWLHHTAGAESGAAGMRNIQTFHMAPTSQGGRGWSDIAYSLVVDPRTLTVYEGRGIGIAGGHTKGDNTESHAICVMGNFDKLHPSGSLLRLLADLVRHGREQQWWGELTGGHRQAPGASTACPGRFLQAAIPEIQALSRASVPVPREDDDVQQTIVFYADGRGGNHAYLLTNNIGKYLGSAESIGLADWLKIDRANKPSEPLGPEWQEIAVLMDGPLCNVGAA